TPTPTPTPPGSPPPSEPKQTAPGMLNTGELDFLSEGVPPKAEAPAFQESGGAAAGGTVVTPAADTASVTRPEGDGGGNGARLGMIAGAAVLVLGTVAFLVFGGDGDPDGDRSGDGDVGTAGNRPPTAVTMIGTEAVDLGGTFELQASASDPDGDPLRYTWKFPSECMAALSSTDSNSIRLRLLDGLPDVELRVTCLADDGHEGHAPAVGNFDVTVGACPMTMPLFGWKKGGWTERGGCFWSQPMSNPEVPTMFHAAGRVRSGPGALETSLGSEVYWEWSGLLRPSDMPGEGDEDLPGRGTVTLLFGERGYRFVCGLDDGETKWSIELQERVPGTEEWRPMAERYERKWKQPDSDNEHRAAWSIRRERDRLVLQLGEFVQPIPPGGGDLPEPVYARNVPVPIVLDEAGVAALNDGRLLLGVEQARCAFHVTRR
ncbi:MAG: hypothetical protein KAI24_12230, partial [Planctomycetes bacterium]|nr:hypothetical protein [Planctomycetota bacterium]